MTSFEDISRQQWAVVAPVWADLIAHDVLNAAGLRSIRHELRSAAWDGLAPHQRLQRAQLLDAVVRRLDQHEPGTGWLSWGRAVGDLLEAAPDDASALDEHN